MFILQYLLYLVAVTAFLRSTQQNVFNSECLCLSYSIFTVLWWLLPLFYVNLLLRFCPLLTTIILDSSFELFTHLDKRRISSALASIQRKLFTNTNENVKNVDIGQYNHFLIPRVILWIEAKAEQMRFLSRSTAVSKQLETGVLPQMPFIKDD